MKFDITLNRNRKRIEYFIIKFLIRNLFHTKIRNTNFYRQWYCSPMNYVRIMEIPLTMLMLNVKPKERLLDIGSPKILSFFYGLELGNPVVSSDLHDYFKSDFDLYKSTYGTNIESVTFNAALHIPYPANYFDKIFSISVIEHIPYNGDREAISQFKRVIKPGGTIVLTVPAHVEYCEEWLKEKTFYWDSKADVSGRTFFQRRYDRLSIIDRFEVDGLQITDIIYLAEHPIKSPFFNYNGRFIYNWQYGKNLSWSKILSNLKYVPLRNYISERIISHKYHYLTKNHYDKNIRQAIVRIYKPT